MSELNVDKSETAPSPSGSNAIEWDDFMRVDLRVGTIISVEEFPEARRPAYKLQVDFGDAIGIKKSSAQITELYDRAFQRLLAFLFRCQKGHGINFAYHACCFIHFEMLLLAVGRAGSF